MATEFKKRLTELEEAERLLSSIASTKRAKRSELDRLAELVTALHQAADSFSKKRQETIEEEVNGEKRLVPKYYGPKMMEKVLDFEQKVEQFEKEYRAVEPLEQLVIEEDTSSKESTVPASSMTTSSDHIPSTGLPVPQGPTIIQVSESEQRKRQQQQENENAQKAMGAFKVLEEKKADDPLTLEQQAFAGLRITKGLAGFQEAISRVDSERRRNLAAILNAVAKNPENSLFRTLSLANPSVAELLQGEGVKQALGSLGFRPQLMKLKDKDVEAITYFLVEPSVEHDFDAWSIWFDNIKAAASQASSF